MPKIIPYKKLSLKDIANESWKDVPDYSGYYQVSNCGRYKTLERLVERSTKGDFLLKERIKKLTVISSLNPYTGKYSPQLTISLSRDANDQTFAATRFVYYCFVKKFDLTNPKLIVTCGDGNKLNNHLLRRWVESIGQSPLKTSDD